MKRKSFILCLFSCIFSLNLIAQFPARVKNNNPSYFEKSGMYIIWGDHKEEILQYKSIKSYTANLDLKKEELADLIGKPLSIKTSTGEPVKINKAEMAVMRSPTIKTFNVILDSIIHINPADVDAIKKYIREGDYFSFKLEIIESTLFALTAEVVSPNPVWTPVSRTTILNGGAKEATSQIINKYGKSYIKVDPDDPENAEMIKLYTGSKEIQLIPIKGFRSLRNYIKADFYEDSVKTINLLKTPYTDPEITTFNEFIDHNRRKPSLYWRGLSISTQNEKYDLTQFVKDTSTTMSIGLGNQRLPLEQFELVIYPGKGEKKRFITKDQNADQIKKEINNLPEMSSIYVTKILVKNKDGNLVLFPETFVIHLF